MDVRQLEMFLAVAEEGGFTRAGERLHVSQSAISRQIGLLEKELGGPLFNRDGRSVSLTHPGEILVGTANNLFREMQRLVEQLSDVHELRRGRLRLAGGMSVCMYVLPRLLKRYRRLHPDVDVRVSSGSSEMILRKLRGHEMDLALLTLPVIAKDLEVIPVLKEEMVVVTAPRHPLARKRVVDAREIGRFPLILYETGSRTRETIENFLREENVSADVAMETENAEIIKAMVGSGIGITVLSHATVAPDLRHKRLAVARIRGRKLYRETGWVYLKSDYVPRTVTEMLRVFELMRGEFTSKLPSGR
ncbi:MAG TPA: LysR family transcriptional regulator [Thermoanaerobaculia bacterium]|jgi:DNA-binding transcriptional LysR family regulator|nr:LysR family transcriptional regulator [Thermoanaerobaculia bacterium]